jgi:hypothetical protein
VNVNVKEYQLIRLRALAVESGHSVSTVVCGIIDLYFSQGKVANTVDDKMSRLVRDVVSAVERYNRRRPVTDAQDDERMKLLRGDGWTYPELAQEFECSVPTVRRRLGSIRATTTSPPSATLGTRPRKQP